MSGSETVNGTLFTCICFFSKTSEGREKTKDQSEKVFLLKAALKHILNFKYTPKTPIKIY